jgi:hypothetical protein
MNQSFGLVSFGVPSALDRYFIQAVLCLLEESISVRYKESHVIFQHSRRRFVGHDPDTYSGQHLVVNHDAGGIEVGWDICVVTPFQCRLDGHPAGSDIGICVHENAEAFQVSARLQAWGYLVVKRLEASLVANLEMRLEPVALEDSQDDMLRVC